MTSQNIRRSIQEIYDNYRQRVYSDEFTLDSISTIFDIGNEIFLKNNDVEVEKIYNRQPSNAPDIMDDEPYSLDRALAIYEMLSPTYSHINTELVQKVFEVNSKFAWKDYKIKYREYIYSIYQEYTNDEYINYLAAVLFYEERNYHQALKCINFALIQNNSSSLFTHIKGLCLIQLGEFESARTYLYQALFLMELLQDIPPRLHGSPEIYPNYPIEYHTSADLVRSDLNKLDKVDSFFDYHVMPLVAGQSV